jgi:hypothetical protein
MTFDHLSPEEVVETRLTYTRAADILSRRIQSSEDRLATLGALADVARSLPPDVETLVADYIRKGKVKCVRSLIVLLTESARDLAQLERDELVRQRQTAEARIKVLLDREVA